MPILQLNNISYKPRLNYSGNAKSSGFELSQISFVLEENEAVAIIGESGGGKTLLAKIIAGLITPDSGNIYQSFSWNDKSSPVQLLFQNSNESINPYRMADDYLLYPANNFNDVKYYLDLLKLPESILEKKAGNLSGGERQRIALARLLLSNPKILVLDEPFSAQDIDSQLTIKNILLDIKSKLNLSLIIVSHTISILEGLADKIIVLKDGKVLEQGSYSKITTEPGHSYTEFLLKAAEYNLTRQEISAVKDY